MSPARRWPVLGCGGAGLAIAAAFLPWPLWPYAGLLAFLCAAVAAWDLEQLIIPDLYNAAIFAAGVLLVLHEDWLSGGPTTLPEALMRAAVSGGSLLAVRLGYRALTGVEGIGLGDVKFAAAAGPWLGWFSLPVAVELAALAALAAIGARWLIARERPGRRTPLPFGAFLAFALWTTFMLERSGALEGLMATFS